MSFPTNDRRADEKLGEKLGLILGRVGSVRWRLNSLAAQHATLYTLAIVIAASATIYAAAYLLSDDARNVTGTTLYVDSGYHAMGM